MVSSKVSGGTHKSLDQHVGAKLRNGRKAIGITPEMMAGVMGVSAEAYERIERGEERPSGQALHRASLILNVSITYFFKDFMAGDAAVPSGDNGDPTDAKP
jgi:transcriptional regulator with XRE-family HTH domain